MHIRREGDEHDSEDGYLRFSSHSYADRAYTLYHNFKFTYGATLQLRMYRRPGYDPEVKGDILQLSNLASQTNNEHRLYDLFRPFGPLQLCISNGQGSATIQYFKQADSARAIQHMVKMIGKGGPRSIEINLPPWIGWYGIGW